MDDGTASTSCSGKCQNGGVCVSGECHCRTGFEGSYCQYRGINLWFNYL